MPVSVKLKAATPESVALQGDGLGARLRRRRSTLRHRRIDAAALLCVDPKTLMWWERDQRTPRANAYPTVIEYLGYEPWPTPNTLAQALLAERRRRGVDIRTAAGLVGVDEGTWGKWEQGTSKPMARTRMMIDKFLAGPGGDPTAMAATSADDVILIDLQQRLGNVADGVEHVEAAHPRIGDA